MNIITIECTKCGTKFMTTYTAGKVTCPECGASDIMEIEEDK